MTHAAQAGRAGKPPATVELHDIDLIFGVRPVLCDLTLTLTQRRVGVIGRNGSGKTSLARVLTGLIAPDQGYVRVNGVDVFKDRKGALNQIGIIFQNPDHQIIFPTVGEEIAFGVRQQGHDKQISREMARQALERFGVGDWAERAVSELSQGQKHLVCLMSVLAMRPAVIVLDEPFTGLDYPTSLALSRVLAALEEMVVHITHDLDALAGYDRVIWLEEGRVQGDGPADEVLSAYRAAMKDWGTDRDAVTHITG